MSALVEYSVEKQTLKKLIKVKSERVACCLLLFLLWTHTLRHFYNGPIALTQESG